MRILLRYLAFLLLFAGLPGVAYAGDRVALVIGVGDYRNTTALRNPPQDADIVASALAGAGFEVSRATTGLLTTRASLTRLLLDFEAKARSADAAVVYFSGHGMQLGNANWLLPVDAETQSPNAVRASSLPGNLFTDAVKSARNLRLVILDACRDNPFAIGSAWSDGTKGSQPKGLMREPVDDNVVMLLATREGATAEDGAERNSPFATALAAAISYPAMQAGQLPGAIASAMLKQGVRQFPDQVGIIMNSGWMFHPGAHVAMTYPANPGPVLSPSPQPALVQQAMRPQVGISANAAALIRECDRLAASEFDPDRPADLPFVASEHVRPALAIPACSKAVDVAPGDARMMMQLGRSYWEHGDTGKAVPWFEKAAAMGEPVAMNSLGNCYDGGLGGVDQDWAQARHWYELAAAKGHKMAMYNLGMMYVRGSGVTRDNAQARRWFEQAAAKGIPDAQKWLDRHPQ